LSMNIMKVICINHSQLRELQRAAKSMALAVMGAWHKQHFYAISRAAANEMSSSNLPLFSIAIETGSEEEEFFVESLGLKSLPSLLEFKQGKLSRAVDLTYSGVKDSSVARYTFDKGASFDDLMNIGRLFLSGDRSSVGKSSMCLGLLVSLLRRGVHPSTLAYIKPVTQCEAEQPVTQFCNRVGIANRAISPVVFYKGFTRAFLSGQAGTAESMLTEIDEAVGQLSRGRTFVLIDGVGYPAVGSICSISNAAVAAKLRAPVVLVGKSGVGDAVDSYNLNSAFFEHSGVCVLGGIFNKLPLEGYYSVEACKGAVTQYFELFKSNQLPYGFVPELKSSQTDDSANGNNHSKGSAATVVSEGAMEVDDGNGVQKTLDQSLTDFEKQISDAFMQHVDVDRLLNDVWRHQVAFCTSLHYPTSTYVFVCVCFLVLP
jgi:dethiobiotin synthetase